MEKLGFGFLRLPRKNLLDEFSTDDVLLRQMVDLYVQRGGTYFDTAFNYLSGESECALNRCVISRYPRQRLCIADKLPSWLVTCKEDCQRIFDTQLQRTGAGYFDVYQLHWLNAANYAQALKFDQFAFIARQKQAGLVGKIGFSFHDSAALLDEILTAHPEMDYVQLQLNYLDWENPIVQARACYDVARKHRKPIIVMEPVKGGTLAQVPPEAAQAFSAADPALSPSQWALRYVAALPGVERVLSGMSTLEQVEENTADFSPALPEHEPVFEAASRIIQEKIAIGCTGCGYCQSGCPARIPIPRYFSLYNEYARKRTDDWKLRPLYAALAQEGGRASACIGCGQCEAHCPQRLSIQKYLKKVARALEE